jgi:hypothetical protein
MIVNKNQVREDTINDKYKSGCKQPGMGLLNKGIP